MAIAACCAFSHKLLIDPYKLVTNEIAIEIVDKEHLPYFYLV